MKQFDIELAKAGHRVCTRDGRPVRILCFDRKSVDGYSILALVDEGNYESFIVYTSRGKFSEYKKGNDPYDLFVASVKKEGWINIYENGSTSKAIYPCKEDALDCHDPVGYITTIKIEWEE